MSELRIITTPDGTILGVHSWTEGFIPLKLPKRSLYTSDADIAEDTKDTQKHCEKDAFSSKKRRD